MIICISVVVNIGLIASRTISISTSMICIHNIVSFPTWVDRIILMQNGGRGGHENRGNYGSYNGRDSSREPYSSANREFSGGGGGGYRIPAHKMVYDGKRMRKAITRRTIDFNATVLRGLQVIIPTIPVFINSFLDF